MASNNGLIGSYIFLGFWLVILAPTGPLLQNTLFQGRSSERVPKPSPSARNTLGARKVSSWYAAISRHWL